MTKPNPIELVKSIRLAKIKENEARRHRVELEEQLVAALGAKEEGSETHEVGDFRVTITGKLTRSVDWAKIDELVSPAWRPVKWKRELDMKKLRALESSQHEPTAAVVLAQVEECITIKPAKTAVTIKERK